MEASELTTILKDFPEYTIFIRSNIGDVFEVVKEVTLNHDLQHITIWG